MNTYDYMDKFGTALQADAGILAYCQTNFDKGLLIRIDDDSEKMIGSNDAPYCLLMGTSPGDDSAVSEASSMSVRMEVGTVSNDEDPSITNERTADANGFEKLGNGEKALDLFDLCLAVIKATILDAFTIAPGSTVDVNGSLYYPLALAVSTITITENKDLSTWD